MIEEIKLILGTDKLTQEQKTDIIKTIVKNNNWYPHWYWPYYPYDTHTYPGQIMYGQETVQVPENVEKYINKYINYKTNG